MADDMEIDQSNDFSKNQIDDLLHQSLMHQSNIVSNEIAPTVDDVEEINDPKNINIKYTCSISLREHNSIYDYSDKITNVASVISTHNALQILVWINSWDIINIYFSPEILQEYQFSPRISRHEVLEQIKVVFENLSFTSGENDAGLKNVMKSIFSIFSSTVSRDSSILGTSLVDERKSIEMQSISELSGILSLISKTLLEMLTFSNPDLYENTPITTTEFIAMFIFQLSLLIKSKTERDDIAQTQITHIFGMLIIDVLTDRISRVLWIPKQTSVTRAIMNEFYATCPALREFTYNKYTDGTSVNKQNHDKVFKFVEDNERLKVYNLEAFLYSANFDEKNRVAFILEQLFMKLEQKDMAQKTIERFTKYIEAMKSDTVKYQIYNESLITVFFEIDGFMEMLQRNSKNYDLNIPFDQITPKFN